MFLFMVEVFLFDLGLEWLWRLGDKLERRSVPMVIPKTGAAVVSSKQS